MSDISEKEFANIFSKFLYYKGNSIELKSVEKGDDGKFTVHYKVKKYES